MIDYNVLINRMIDSHQIVELLGYGGMGAVYKAYDNGMQRWEALKIINPKLLTQPELIQQFKIEAEAATGLNHYNIAQLYYVGNFQNVPYYTMEFIEGKSFSDIMREKGRISGSISMSYLYQVCDGLEYCQFNGVVHRDLKPANLMVSNDGIIKVVDFGLALVLQEGSWSQEAEQILGTPKYIAPESGTTKILDHRSDIYSLGATFYHLMAGEPPFTASSPVELLQKHINEPLIPLVERNSLVPEVVSDIINKMMAKNPKERYQSYKELKDDIKAAKASGFRKQKGMAVGSPPSYQKEEGTKKKKSNLMPLYLILGTLILAIIAVLLQEAQTEPDEDSGPAPVGYSDGSRDDSRPSPGSEPIRTPIERWNRGLEAVQTAKKQALRAKMIQISIMVEQYYADKGEIPESMEVLIKQYRMPPSMGRDSWGKKIIIEDLGNGEYSLVSPGPDGVFDTSDDVEFRNREFVS